MSFSPQLPLNTKRGVVRRNQVVNTKWPHFIYCTVLVLPIAMHQGSHFNEVVNTKWQHFIYCTVLMLPIVMHQGSHFNKVENTKCPHFIYCTVFYCSISSCYLLQCTMRFIKTKIISSQLRRIFSTLQHKKLL